MGRKRLYHLSAALFDRFHQKEAGGPRSVDTGYHVGTKQTALTAADKLAKQGRIEPGDEVYLYEIQADVGTPLRMEENRLGSWSVGSILRDLIDSEAEGTALQPMLSEEEIDAALEDEVLVDGSDVGLDEQENLLDHIGAQEEHPLFRRWLNDHGYDSIVYTNTYEGGGDSYILLDPDQAQIVSVETYTV